ncbi:MAG: FAD/NAD(P)-binding oxidoreductase [Pseudomonadota bacterium]
MNKDIVIIGGGQAASSFAARIRKHTEDRAVTMIGEESHFPYQRPPLSKKYATGEMAADQLLLRSEDWYEANTIEFMAGTRVAGINIQDKRLQLSNGHEMSWKTLVFATGSRPRTLPAEMGGALEGVYALRGIADADNFAAELKQGRRVTIVGGGYIGLEAAAVCASKGLDVTLVEAAPRILQRVACPQTSDWFRKHHQDMGVKIYENTGLNKIEASGTKASGILLSDDTRIEADFVLVGIGIIPNADLAQEAGLEVEGGIKVNDFCQTSHPDVYAAGDCAAFMYRGEITRLESVQNAIDQAECAADNVAGQPRKYEPHPWFWSDQYDVKLQIAGLNRGYDSIVVRPGEREGSISHFYFLNDNLLAVDSMNDPRTYMVAKKMLEAGKNISKEQAADQALQLKSLL